LPNTQPACRRRAAGCGFCGFQQAEDPFQRSVSGSVRQSRQLPPLIDVPIEHRKAELPAAEVVKEGAVVTPEARSTSSKDVS
jgi:hypothetical protein